MLLGRGELTALGLDFQRCWPCECRGGDLLPFLHGPPHAVNGPVLACSDHAHPRAVSLIDKRVGAKFVTNFRNEEVSSWQPVQGQSNIARPNPPQRTVFKFNDVALVVFLNEHHIPRALGALSGQPGRERPGCGSGQRRGLFRQPTAIAKLRLPTTF